MTSDAQKKAQAAYLKTDAGKAAQLAARAKWKAANQTPEAKEKARASRRKWKETHRDENNAARRLARTKARERNRAKVDKRPFAACDGEGVGRGADHRYVLFRMGTRELYRDGATLECPDILAFICDHPKGDRLTAFAFDYDATMILKSLPKPKIEAILAAWGKKSDPDQGAAKGNPWNRWTWLDFGPKGRFGVDWLSRNHFKVCRAGVRGSARCIEDAWPNFNKSFLASIVQRKIGTDDERETIRVNKMQRSAFSEITPEIRAYNALECKLLAAMMEGFRRDCLNAGIRPKTYNGGGKIATFLLKQSATLTTKQVAAIVDKSVLDMAHAAYYGGRFEVMRIGRVIGPIRQFDINSAYPHAMLSLPCLEHGTWAPASGADLEDAAGDAIFVCSVAFSHPIGQFVCGLSHRSKKDGRLSWPRLGRGVYWSPEIRSARDLGAACELGDGFLYERRCDCRPFAWVEDKYKLRKALGDAGEPFKVGINSLYGKLAQRIGDPQFANPIWAGLVTAMTRAALNHAVQLAGQANVVMIATDAVYVFSESRLTVGKGLGEWSMESYPELFIVQPGLWWPPASNEWKVRSRGLAPKFFEPVTPRFEGAWRDYADGPRGGILDLFGEPPPSVEIAIEPFIGLRLAAHWGRLDLAGRFVSIDDPDPSIAKLGRRHIRFDWRAKRSVANVAWDGDAAILQPKQGDKDAVSAHYDADGKLETSTPWEIERLLTEAMPDPIDLSAPFTLK